MHTFNPQHDLKIALMTMLSHRLVVREAQENLATAFSTLDHDNDGVVSEGDFALAFQGSDEVSTE